MDKKANCLTTEMQFYQYIGPCGCAMRGRYFESGNRFEKHEGGTYQALEVRKDGKTNAITTVTKDCMICEPVRLGHIGKSKGQANRIYSVHGKSVCLQAQAGGGGAKTGLYRVDLPDGDYLVRKLYPLEAERLQTLPDGYTEGISDTQRYKCIGNGWTVDVIAHIFRSLREVYEMKSFPCGTCAHGEKVDEDRDFWQGNNHIFQKKGSVNCHAGNMSITFNGDEMICSSYQKEGDVNASDE